MALTHDKHPEVDIDYDAFVGENQENHLEDNKDYENIGQFYVIFDGEKVMISDLEVATLHTFYKKIA